MAEGPVAIIAGGGQFPEEVASAALAAGHRVAVVGIRGFAARRIAGQAATLVDLLDPAGLLTALKAIGPSCVVLAGSVTRPGPMAITAVFSAFRHREELGRLLAGGDDRLLRGVVALIEEAGFPVVGAQAVAPSVLAPTGVLTRRAPRDGEVADAAQGAALLAALSPFDVGQGVVVCGGRVLAVEGPEGTDAMLSRVASLQRRRRVRLDGQGGVLVKWPKRDQDTRVDLPAVGPRTIKAMRSAGLTALAIAAGGVVTIERTAMVAAADRAGIAISGIMP